MGTRSAVVRSMYFLALTVVLNGCGGGGGGFFTAPPAKGQSGRLVQGPVKGATIFADSTDAGVSFVQDAGEIGTITDDDGNFTLPSIPGYGYILVSKGGTDKLTNQPAIQMLAPAGSANVTPITTLVALDTTGSVKAKLVALMPPGSAFDADISTIASPAVLMVIKSVEATVQSMTSAITTSALSHGDTISAPQLSSIQAQAMQSIAAEIAALPAGTATTTLSAPTSLSTTLQAAATAAAVNITTANSNITSFPAGTARTLASTAVTATATALSVGATATTTAIPGGEAAVMTSAAAAAFTTAVQNASTTAATSVTANTTPPAYTPPTIPVATGATGGTSGGTGTGF